MKKRIDNYLRGIYNSRAKKKQARCPPSSPDSNQLVQVKRQKLFWVFYVCGCYASAHFVFSGGV